ncbi:RICIN domain-containing protein [Nocardia halotolerans]|uniref:RICIN domain-containing protein n=1 Tax=Nocardia halotolerans TaxID=1755878 RepID=A0ABV8VJP7_9NOCA
MDFPEGSFFIRNVASDLMLDVKGASTQPGAGIVLEDRNTSGTANSQLWKYDNGFIVNVNSGLVLEVPGFEGGGNIRPGSALAQADKREQPDSLNQLWAYNYEHLMPYDPKVCVQGQGGETSAGTEVVADHLIMHELTQQWMLDPQ